MCPWEDCSEESQPQASERLTFARLTRAWEATKSALTTELYDRGALTTNCWPLCFDDVTEVLA